MAMKEEALSYARDIWTDYVFVSEARESEKCSI